MLNGFTSVKINWTKCSETIISVIIIIGFMLITPYVLKVSNIYIRLIEALIMLIVILRLSNVSRLIISGLKYCKQWLLRKKTSD